VRTSSAGLTQLSPAMAEDGQCVSVDDLSVVYRTAAGHTVHALQSVSMSLRKRTFVALAGPSGSGKSTMLYVLAGLLRPSSGSANVCGNDLGAMDPAQLARFRGSNLGFVFQSFQLLPHLRAWENVALPLLPLGIAPSDRRRRACQLLSTFGLGTSINHRPGELSAGEQQRVAMARAIVNSPSLVFADEPTGNLDAANAELIGNQLHGLVQQLGATVICATHDERLASRATVIVRLEHGRITAVEDRR
jgi:putative ABC transport system ATP-binding protein